MRILFFTKGDRTIASSRQRVWFLAEKLHSAYGYEYEVVHGAHYPLFSLRLKRFRIMGHVMRTLFTSEYDILFIHKSFFSWDIVLLIIFAKIFWQKKLVYDLDDAQWIHSLAKTKMFAKFASATFCGSHVIQEWARTYTKNAVLIPTVVDFDAYNAYAIRYEHRDVYTIGWVGTGMRHFKDGLFGIIKPALDSLHEHGVKFRFVVLGAQSHEPLKQYFKNSKFDTLFIDELDWSDASSAVPRAMHSHRFDIGLMPQNDTPFNRAKCSFKAVEYMACGIPPIASNVGENSVLIKDGEDGFLAATTQEWYQRMRKLLQDVSLRHSMGTKAQEKIKRHYSYTAILPELRQWLD
jgi:glycosyltransferase involved in cell wall biosynthesis